MNMDTDDASCVQNFGKINGTVLFFLESTRLKARKICIEIPYIQGIFLHTLKNIGAAYPKC